MTIKGYPSSEKLDNTSTQYATVQPIGLYRHGAEVIANTYAAVVAADIVEASSTAYIINATAHLAKRGMLLRMTSGATSGEFATVISTTANTIVLGASLSVAPSAADTFDIMRWTIPEASASGGALSVSISTAQRVKVDLVRVDYLSTPVTTAAYVQLIAATSAASYVFHIFDSSGETIILATGAAASEVPLLYIQPGGFSSPFELYVAAGTRLSIKALSANTAGGELIVTTTT